MINTIYGEMDEALLFKKEGNFEDDNEITSWVEYYLNEELVHRSADIFIKEGIAQLLEQGGF